MNHNVLLITFPGDHDVKLSLSRGCELLQAPPPALLHRRPQPVAQEPRPLPLVKALPSLTLLLCLGSLICFGRRHLRAPSSAALLKDGLGPGLAHPSPLRLLPPLPFL